MQPSNAPIFLWVALLAASLSGESYADPEVRSVGQGDPRGSSMAVVVGPAALAHTAQLLPMDERGRVVAPGQATEQAERVLANLAKALEEVRSGLDRLVKVNVYLARPEVAEQVEEALARAFTGRTKPAVSLVEGTLAHPDALVAMDAVAVTPIAADDRPVRRLSCAGLPGVLGGSHVAILPEGPRVYVSGQAEMADDLAEATRRTMASLRATLAHLGLDDSDVVQVKAFLRPMAAVGEVEREVVASFGDRPAPPMAFVEWDSPLPIEIELIAAAGGGRRGSGEVIEYLTPPGLKPSPVYSRVARIDRGGTIYVSGLYGGKSQDAGAEVEAIFEALGRVMEEAGGDLRHLAKATYYVSGEEASRKLNELRPRFFDPSRPPAASKAMVAGVGRAGRSITLDMIAVPSPARDVAKPE